MDASDLLKYGNAMGPQQYAINSVTGGGFSGGNNSGGSNGSNPGTSGYSEASSAGGDVNWQMQNPYASTAMEKNYWDPNNQENTYLKNRYDQMNQVYNQQGKQVQSELGRQGIQGTVGQFAQAQRVANPQANAISGIEQDVYGKRWQGEQGQFGRQADYTKQLNDLAMQKALAEQKSRVDLYSNARDRQAKGKQGDSANQAGALGSMGSAAVSAAPAIMAAFSDRKLKKHIAPIQFALDMIDKLKPKKYKYKGTSKETYGVIAQDLEKVFPDLVCEMDNGFLAIDVYGLVGICIAAIKELKDKVKKLEKKGA